jgi:hypothetical protein
MGGFSRIRVVFTHRGWHLKSEEPGQILEKVPEFSQFQEKKKKGCTGRGRIDGRS